MATLLRITKREVDAAQPPATGEVKIWDCEMKGFGLRVRAGGTKSYILQYRNTEGRTRRLTVGLCGRTTHRYTHFADDPLRAAADRVVAEIDCALRGGPSAEVIPLRLGQALAGTGKS